MRKACPARPNDRTPGDSGDNYCGHVALAPAMGDEDDEDAEGWHDLNSDSAEEDEHAQLSAAELAAADLSAAEPAVAELAAMKPPLDDATVTPVPAELQAGVAARALEKMKDLGVTQTSVALQVRAR